MPLAISAPPRMLLAAFAMSLCGAVALATVLAVKFITPAGLTAPASIYAGRVNDFGVGDPQQFFDGRFWLVRLGDRNFVALYWKDPYRGCTVPWRPDFRWPPGGEKGWFRNPCTGATFDLTGQCVQGPCVRGLDRFEVELRGNGVYVWADTRHLTAGPPGPPGLLPLR